MTPRGTQFSVSQSALPNFPVRDEKWTICSNDSRSSFGGTYKLAKAGRYWPCEIVDSDAVNTSVEGQHTVCVIIGRGPTLKPVFLFSEGTKNDIAAMKRLSVSKLICVTGIGAGDSKGHGGILLR